MNHSANATTCGVIIALLANVDATMPELAAKLPALMALRADLYSEGFRAQVSKICGCGELTNRVDMAASVYIAGCHLLCHDDVIGTRAVSFIVYVVLGLYGVDI